mmetsp:Transcript_21076/g.33676  ORF Transcript_21076/g.33676 Transcript_21076/m.33676 type:complete len:217 (-) Transcript_21076:110-760(-)
MATETERTEEKEVGRSAPAAEQSGNQKSKTVINKAFYDPMGGYEHWSLKDDQYVYDRLSSQFGIISALSGVIAGFTYIVSNAGIEFTEGEFIPDNIRKEIFGSLVAIAFCLSLTSALLSASTGIFLNINGPDDAHWFFQTFNTKLDYSWQLMNFSLIVMLVSIIISVGGNFGLITWIITIVSVIGMSILFYVVYSSIRLKTYAHSKEKFDNANSKS